MYHRHEGHMVPKDVRKRASNPSASTDMMAVNHRGSVWFNQGAGSLARIFWKGNQVLLTAELSPQHQS